MNVSINISPLKLYFKRPSGTSRGILKEKNSWIIELVDKVDPYRKGVGECSIIESLSPDWNDSYIESLNTLVQNPSLVNNIQSEWFDDKPSIKFGVEMALKDFETKNNRQFFESNNFTKGLEGIPINGLIWMGDPIFMKDQIDEKLSQGYRCIKLKIGAIDFNQELKLLSFIRERFDASKIELRVDANGAFHPLDALNKLNQLSKFDLHSIEQPIRQGQWIEMADLCEESPLDIALDEELIGVKRIDRARLLDTIKPPFIILKPSLVGGFQESEHWIDLCEKRNIRWWITSALESNIGLEAIAEWVYTLNNSLPQGLGTGQLYTNNVKSPLQIERGSLYYRK
jgi:o-succinylbenzoate synthase